MTDAGANKESPTVQSEVHLLAQLDAAIVSEIKFDDEPLPELVAKLFEDAGTSDEIPFKIAPSVSAKLVTFHSSEIQLSSALTEITKRANCEWLIREGQIEILPMLVRGYKDDETEVEVFPITRSMVRENHHPKRSQAPGDPFAPQPPEQWYEKWTSFSDNSPRESE